MKKLAAVFFIASALLLTFSASVAQAAGIKIVGVENTYKLEVDSFTVQKIRIDLEPALASAPRNDVTLRASLDKKIPELQITEGASLVFTSQNFATKQLVVISVNGDIKPNLTAALTLSGSGIETKKVAITSVTAGNGSTETDKTSAVNTGPAGFGSPLSALISEEKGFVFQSWKITRSIINILLIIALLAISFSNITRINIDTYTIKKALPNLLIGVILANASLYIIRFMSDITTVVTYFFVNQAGSTTFAKFIGDAAELIGKNTLDTVGVIGGILSPILIFLFAIVTIIGLLWLAFLLYFRLVAIYLLTILSPLAFVSYGIPGFDKYFQQWWQQFTKWLFIVPAMSAVFWLMIVIGQNNEGGQSIARLLIMYVLFFTALTLPSKMGGAVIDKASKFFTKNPVSKFATDQATDLGRNIGSRVASRTGITRIQEWNKLRKEKFEKDIELRRMMGKENASRGLVGRQIGRQTKIEEKLKANEARITAENIRAAVEADPSLQDKLTIAEMMKDASEKRLEETKKLHRLSFLKKAQTSAETLKTLKGNEKKFVTEIKAVLEEFADATADEEIISGEVGREEGIIKGNKMNQLYQVPQLLTNYKEYKKELEHLDDKLNKLTDDERSKGLDKVIEAEKATINERISSVVKSYDSLKTKDQYKYLGDVDLSNVDIDQAFQLVGGKIDGKAEFADKHVEAARIAQGQQRQALKAFNAGVQGQIKDEIKETSVAQLERELSGYLEEDLREYAKIKDAEGKAVKDAAGNFTYNDSLHNQLKQAFFSGDTAKLSLLGLKDHEVRNGIVIAEKFKTIQKSVNDVRFQEGLTTWMNEANNAFEPLGETVFTEEDFANAKSKNSSERKDAAAKATEIGIMAQGPAARQQRGADQVNRSNSRSTTSSPTTTSVPPPPDPKKYFSEEDIANAGGPEEVARLGGNPKSYEQALREYEQQHGPVTKGSAQDEGEAFDDTPEETEEGS